MAIMLASFSLTLVAYAETRSRLLRRYLIYLACYALLLLCSVYFYLRAVYLPFPLELPSLGAAVAGILVSIFTLHAGPIFALQAAGLPLGRRERWLLSIPVAFVFGAVLIYYLSASARVAVVPNAFFSLYLGTVFLFCGLRSRAAGGSEGDPLRTLFLPFLWLSAGAYAVMLAENVLTVAAPAFTASPLPASATVWLYGLTWSLLMIPRILRFRAGDVQHPAFPGLPAGFAGSFGVTESERGIVEDMMRGMEIAEIAEKRLVPPEAVEGTITDIFRKCEVASRDELLRLLDRFRSQA